MKKPEKMTIAEYNDQMMEDALSLLRSAAWELVKAKKHIDKAQDRISLAAEQAEQARIDE